MDNREIVDIISAAESYLKKLQKLDENITRAESQITNSSIESLRQINTLFTTLKTQVIQLLDTRQIQLQTDILEIQNNGMEPLGQCHVVICDKITKTNKLIANGNKLLESHKKADQADFYAQSLSLGNLPAVPSLTEVPCINFTYSGGAELELFEFCKNIGTVYQTSPVQIHSLIEKPGGILVGWEENDLVDDKLNNIQEFRLQFALGDFLGSPDLQLNFHDCYIGTNMEYLKKDLKLSEPYTFRVCCKMEGSHEWSPWSILQVAQTNLNPFCWNSKQINFTLNNERKIATKTDHALAILLSNGPQFKPNNSIEFTILELADQELSLINGVGLCDEADIKCLNVDSYSSLNTFLVMFNGNVSIGGKGMSMKMPRLKQGCKISFTCEEEINDKVRIFVDSQDKTVTYDWKVSDIENLYFFVIAESHKFKILVE